jgi:hypothetical protein
MIRTDPLVWHDANPKQVLGILMRNGISSSTWHIARKRFNDPSWDGGPDIYVIDTLTDKGARVTIQGQDEFDVKVSSRTGQELLHDLLYGGEFTDPIPTWALDKIIVMD